MLYHLAQYLRDDISWLNVFRYQTFRAMLAFLVSFIIVLVLQPIFIRKLKAIGVGGQPIREDGPKDHYSKKGTPTMGGVVVMFALAVSGLLFCDLTNKFVWMLLTVATSYGALGFLDDWRKVTKQNPKGVSGKEKLVWQFSTALIIGLWLYFTSASTALTFPFFKDLALNLGLLWLLFVALVIVGASNAVNLTDGLDGLVVGPVMTVSFTYAIFAYAAGNAKISAYLGIPFVPGAGELAIILSGLFASGLGFLWYNSFPAQVFMGDVGALAIGGVLGLVAVIVKQELLLVVAGGIFVVEAMSVILQVYSFKMTGKRIFKMAPIHHHFELSGWPEPKIIVRFWIISIVLALLSLVTLKLR